jgi:hypothetical protein
MCYLRPFELILVTAASQCVELFGLSQRSAHGFESRLPMIALKWTYNPLKYNFDALQHTSISPRRWLSLIEKSSVLAVACLSRRTAE